MICKCGCGQEIGVLYSKHRTNLLRTYINGHNSRGKRNLGTFKGGRLIDPHGYIIILYDKKHLRADRDGYVREHILIYEDYHQCCMLDWGIIHHKDENRQNNSIDNLEGMTRGQHNTIHKKGKPRIVVFRSRV
jgi:hypothetical protein